MIGAFWIMPWHPQRQPCPGLSPQWPPSNHFETQMTPCNPMYMAPWHPDALNWWDWCQSPCRWWQQWCHKTQFLASLWPLTYDFCPLWQWSHIPCPPTLAMKYQSTGSAICSLWFSDHWLYGSCNWWPVAQTASWPHNSANPASWNP